MRRVTVLLSNSKYCSWEPGHSRQAGALAVVTVLELLRNSDANSVERKEGDLVGRWGGIYRELEKVPRKFFRSRVIQERMRSRALSRVSAY